MEHELKKQVRLCKAGLLVLAALTVAQMASPLLLKRVGAQSPKRTDFEEINAQRINIVDEKGKNMLVISNQREFPNPIVAGKEYPRSIKPAGIVFYNGEGNEVGGIGILDAPNIKANIMAFDYSNSEAIGFSRYEFKDGGYESGFVVLDRQPLEADISKVGSVGKKRITLSNKNRDSQIVLYDTEEKPRIRLVVDAKGTATIEILDKDGKVISRLPAK